MSGVEASVAYLRSDAARASLEKDPYWPKWDSPWWHMALLWELGRADAIPDEAAEALLAAVERRYPPYFPNPREPLPPGKDPRVDALCHCAVGVLYQMLWDKGLDLDGRAPWLRAWLMRYQLPDGGLNCDERVYASGGASSIQSTLPALEAILRVRRDYTPGEEAFLDAGAAYLIERRLAYRKRDGAPMDASFLKLGFPRFYDYDVLRGAAFLADWALALGRDVPRAAIAETLDALTARFPDGTIRVEKPTLPGAGESSFPLLDEFPVGAVSERLTKRWAGVRLLLG